MKQVSSRILLFSGLLVGFFGASFAKAVCPICVVAIGAGLGLSRWLGVDDVISSIWIGALLVAMILWTLTEMKKKNWRFAFDAIVIFLAYYLLIFVPLYYTGILGHPLNKIFGIDKIIFGTILGTAIVLLIHWLNKHLKQKGPDGQPGKPFFPYQKVVIPVVVLLLTSIIFYLLLLYKII
jgi:small-conductance mechanosensitive channel